jgi:hypothetical protein
MRMDPHDTRQQPIASVTTVAAAVAPHRSFAKRFFGVAARPRTYLNLIYLILAFPLGVFYFSFFVSMLATAIGTIIVWVGIPLLALTAVLWWAFAAMERYLADGLLGTHLVPGPQPWRRTVGTWPRIKAHMGAAATWKDLAFLFVKFPLGIVSLAVITAVVSIPAAFITAPFTVGWADWTSTTVKPEDRGFYIQTWHIDTVAEAIVFVPIGIVLLFAGLHVVNGLAAVWRTAAGALLETAGPGRGAAGTAPLDGGPAATLPQPPAGWTPAEAPGAPVGTASYLNVPRPGDVGYLYQGIAPSAATAQPAVAPAEVSAEADAASSPLPAPIPAVPPSARSQPTDDGPVESSAPPRRPQPPKPPIWEEDDA